VLFLKSSDYKKPFKRTAAGSYSKKRTGDATDKPFYKKRDSGDSENAGAKKPFKDSGSSYPKKKFTKGTDSDKSFYKKRSSENEESSAFKKPYKSGGAPYPKKKFSSKFPEEQVAKEPAKRKPFKSKGSREEEDLYVEEVIVSDEIRLNKYLSHAGVASRRKADELIKEGKVTVNGQVVTEMGYKVLRTDKVVFEGKSLNPEKKYYILVNKPKDFITTVSDERNRKTVMDLIRSAYGQMKNNPRLYPVGRLDRNTTGVLLITNDGELAQKLTHPSTEVKKVYHVVLNKKLHKEDFDKIAEGGVVLEDGIAEVDEIAYPNSKNKAEIGVEMHTGKNRFVRRIFEALGYEVEKLDRVYFAGLTKKDLPRGRWRFLKEEEVRLLKHFNSD
jgi:23S rRNA pseudouridine2605 synthase